MRVGLFSSLFDKIQSAYGWDDERVLDLTLRRAVQIRDSIEQREDFARWEALKVTEWQTKNIVAMIANTVEDSKARGQLTDYAKELSLTSSPADTKSNQKPRRAKRTFRTVDGKEITAEELKNYSYDEIDHSDEDQTLISKARNKNLGKDLSGFGGFTR